MKNGFPVFPVALIVLTATLAAQKPETGISLPERGKAVADFVAGGHFIAGQAEADFNGDKLKDLVLVLQKKGEKEEIAGTPRWLVILFRQADGGWRLSLKSRQAVPACGSGLHADEEFGGPWAVNDTFRIRSGFSDGHLGVTTDYQCRFQGNDWYLIGKRSQHLGDVGFPLVKSESDDSEMEIGPDVDWTSRVVDNNFLTGKRVETWRCEAYGSPEIELTLTYDEGEFAKPLHEYFEEGENEEGADGVLTTSD